MELLLPMDCLKIIFHFLKIMDIIHVNQVCTKWKEIIKKWIRDKKTILNFCYWKNIEIINDIDIKWMEIGNKKYPIVNDVRINRKLHIILEPMLVQSSNLFYNYTQVQLNQNEKYKLYLNELKYKTIDCFHAHKFIDPDVQVCLNWLDSLEIYINKKCVESKRDKYLNINQVEYFHYKKWIEKIKNTDISFRSFRIMQPIYTSYQKDPTRQLESNDINIVNHHEKEFMKKNHLFKNMIGSYNQNGKRLSNNNILVKRDDLISICITFHSTENSIDLHLIWFQMIMTKK